MIEIGRLVLAVVLATAGIGKLIDRSGSRRSLAEFRVPARLVAPLAVLLPLAELAIAVALVPAGSARPAAAAGAVLLAVFVVAMAIAMVSGRRPDCHCFGALYSGRAGWGALARNVALLGVAGVVLSRPAADPEAVQLAAVGGGALLAGNALLSFRLLRRHGAALRRIDQLESGAGRPTTLAAGAPAPAFSLPLAGGGELSLGHLLAPGRAVLLLFVDPRCGPCRALLGEVASWQREHGDRLTIAVLSTGAPDENLALAEEHRLDRVLVQEHGEVAELYGARATPSAVVIGPRGRIAHALAEGVDAITALVPATSAAAPAGRAGAATAGALAITLVAAESAAALQAADPEIQAVAAAVRAAVPRLRSAARRSKAAVRAEVDLGRNQQRGVQTERRKQANTALVLRAEIRELRALRTALQRIPPPNNAAANNARIMMMNGLSLLEQSREKQVESLRAAPKTKARLLDEAQKLLLRSVPPLEGASKVLIKR
jgi:peroxiredoxin